MASETATDDTLAAVYERRIGTPSTGNEARGYWTFVAGLVAAFTGIGWLILTDLTGPVPQTPVVIVGLGLVLLLAGPTIRLPLQQWATWLVYTGAAVSLAGLAWFVSVYPGWRSQAQEVIGLYSVGLLVIAVGGVFVPILTDRAELEAEVSDLYAELDELKDAVSSSEATEAELTERVATLQEQLSDAERENTVLQAAADDSEAALTEQIEARKKGLADAERENAALEAEIDRLEDTVADTKADEADLAGVINDHNDSQAQFELYEDRDSEWRWRLRHRNGNVIADSNQGYARKHDAQQGIRAVRRDAFGGSLLLIESEADLPEAESDHGFIFADEVESKATFELYEDGGEGEQYRWRLRHDNGNIIADGREGYSSHEAAETAIERIREYVGPAEYLQPDPTAIEVYSDNADEWRWRLRHRNGNILASSGEGYADRSGARQAIDHIREGIDEMAIEVYEDEAGGYRWRLVGGDGKVKVDSGSYESREGADDAVDRVRTFLPAADLLDIGQAAFEVYEDEAGDHRWRLRHRNDNILAGDGQGYAQKSSMWGGIESMKKNAPNAGIEETEG